MVAWNDPRSVFTGWSLPRSTSASTRRTTSPTSQRICRSSKARIGSESRTSPRSRSIRRAFIPIFSMISSRLAASSGSSLLRILLEHVGQHLQGPQRIPHIVRHRLQQSVFHGVQHTQAGTALLLRAELVGQHPPLLRGLPVEMDRGAQCGVEKPRMQQISRPDQHLTVGEGFGDEILRAALERPITGRDGAVSGQHDHREGFERGKFPYLPQHFEAVQVRHVQVQHDQVGVDLGQSRRHPPGIQFGGQIPVSLPGEDGDEQRDVQRVVVDNEQPGVGKTGRYRCPPPAGPASLGLCVTI